MRKYIVLLLITGTVLAQTNFDSKGWISRDIPSDFDKLILKNGVEYIGEFSSTEFKLHRYNPDDRAQEITIRYICFSASTRAYDQCITAKRWHTSL